MAAKCDLCGGKTGLFRTFHCLDGLVCKNCYRIVSGNYASTIANLTLLELKRRYIKNAQPLDMGEGGFQATRKIGAFLLLDETNSKFCILNNQKMTGQNTRPEIFPCQELKKVEISASPAFSEEQLASLTGEKNSSVVIRKLSVRLELKSAGVREIVIIPTPVRTSTFAFRQGYKVAAEILACLRGI